MVDLEQTQIIEALPAALSPIRMQRLAHKAVNHLGLGLVDVAVESREDGNLAIILPEAWAYLFLAHLEATAGQIQEQLRRAMNQARMKDARIQAELAAAARAWETKQIAIHARFRELCSEGLSKREAIRRIKSEQHDGMTATEIQSVVEGRDPRKTHERKERNARILRLKAEGVKVEEIAAREGIPAGTVKSILTERRKRDATK